MLTIPLAASSFAATKRLIRKIRRRFSRATDAKRLRGDHAQNISLTTAMMSRTKNRRGKG
jgi:hypothetical protein